MQGRRLEECTSGSVEVSSNKISYTGSSERSYKRTNERSNERSNDSSTDGSNQGSIENRIKTIQDAYSYGSKAIFEDLYQQVEAEYEGLLKGVVSYYRWAGDRDDVRQVARVSFFQGVLNYDCEGPVFFPYYIKRKVYGDLRTWTRRIGKRQEKELLLVDDSGDEVPLLDKVICVMGPDSELGWNFLMEGCSLSEKERKLLTYIYVRQDRYTEIGKRMGIDPSTARKAHLRILVKLRKHFEVSSNA